MTKDQKTMLEVLEETKAYYSDDVTRRSIDENGDCRYLCDNGNRCAVSRYIKDDNFSSISSHLKESNPITSLLLRNYAYILKCLNNHHRFWDRIQEFHDISENWDMNGITYKGIWSYESIKSEILSGRFVVSDGY